MTPEFIIVRDGLGRTWQVASKLSDDPPVYYIEMGAGVHHSLLAAEAELAATEQLKGNAA